VTRKQLRKKVLSIRIKPQRMIAENKVQSAKTSGDFLNYLHMQYPWFSKEQIQKVYEIHKGDMHATMIELDEKSRHGKPVEDQEE
jgi:hypothetical protein